MNALLFNTTLKPSPDESHTQLLLEAVGRLLRSEGVAVEHVHVRSAGLAFGVQPDMTAHGATTDGWPSIWPKVLDADIVVVGTPLWLGEESSVCRLLIERLYAMSGELNDRGQSIYYGKVAGSVITGNEDGIKHAAMTLHYALGHLGFTIPPQADAGWIGEAGPGPSYGDPREDGTRVGFDNAFTRRNATILAWNLLHLARILRDAGGYPNHGNDRRAFADGERFGFENPEYRS
jgi:multimeric flavodoxin WrbA